MAHVVGWIGSWTVGWLVLGPPEMPKKKGLFERRLMNSCEFLDSDSFPLLMEK